MHRVFRLAKREYLAAVKTKGFLIMLILMPVLMGGSAIAMYLFRGQVDTKDKHVAILDHSGIVIDMLLKAVEERNAASVYDNETEKKSSLATSLKFWNQIQKIPRPRDSNFQTVSAGVSCTLF